MQRVIIGLSKGGTGKTSTAVNLAHGLALRGRRVLLVDCDEQGAAARALGLKPSAGLAELIAGARPSACITEARPGLDLIAGGRDLAAVKRDIARRDIAAERMLSEALDKLPGYDYEILDTAPGLDGLMINALWAAGRLLSPVELEALAVAALPGYLDKAGQVASYRGAAHAPIEILPTLYSKGIRQSVDILGQLRRHYGGQVLDPIPRNVAISQASARGLSIFEYARQSAGGLAYAQLVDHIEEGRNQ